MGTTTRGEHRWIPVLFVWNRTDSFWNAETETGTGNGHNGSLDFGTRIITDFGTGYPDV